MGEGNPLDLLTSSNLCSEVESEGRSTRDYDWETRRERLIRESFIVITIERFMNHRDAFLDTDLTKSNA